MSLLARLGPRRMGIAKAANGQAPMEVRIARAICGQFSDSLGQRRPECTLHNQTFS
jgi:hypothetical protein